MSALSDDKPLCYFSHVNDALAVFETVEACRALKGVCNGK